jgi:hypothetical protein
VPNQVPSCSYYGDYLKYWIRSRPHINLSQAVNDEGGDVNVAFDRDANVQGTIPQIAKSFKAKGQPWALVVDENYGEGSAREHAALQPRFYGTHRQGRSCFSYFNRFASQVVL